MKIIVNGRTKETTYKMISYNELVKFSYGSFYENDVLIVTYRNDDPKLDGTLTPYKSVQIYDGMVFNVVHANDK